MDNTDKALIKLLGDGLPLVKEPYTEIGTQLGIDEKEVMSRVQKLKDEGVIRRISAYISSEKLGIKENSMTVWNVPDDQLEEVGRKMAQFKEVTHCYQRPRVPGKWQYPLFCMLHQPTRKALEEVAKRISDAVGIKDYWLCIGTKEYKVSK